MVPTAPQKMHVPVPANRPHLLRVISNLRAIWLPRPIPERVTSLLTSIPRASAAELDLDESVTAVGAPGLPGGVELGDRCRVQPGDDVGLQCPEGGDRAWEV